MLLPYPGKIALCPVVLLLAVACSFDASGLVSAGATTTTTSSSTGDTSSTTGAPTTQPPTSMGPDGTASDSGSTTSPVDPTTSTTATTSTGPDLTTGTTDPGTTTTTTDSTTDPGTTTTTTDTTTDPGTSTSTTTDTTTDPGTSSSTGGEMCVDPGPEPNGSEDNAVDHGNQHCKAEPKSFSGVLNGDNDLDYHRFHGDFSGMGCGDMDPDPVVSVALTASDSLQMCVYVDCDMMNSNPEFACPMGTTASTSPGGRPGCCGTGSISFPLGCSGGGNESAVVFIRFNQAPEGACVDYDVEYSFHN